MNPFLLMFWFAILLSLLFVKTMFQWLDARDSGWRRLGRLYSSRAHEAPGGRRFERITIGMNQQCYQRIATASVGEDGLYLRLMAWHRFLHPPLFIPWTKMKVVADGWNTTVQLAAPVHPVSLELAEPIVREVIWHVARRSPYWLPGFRQVEKVRPRHECSRSPVGESPMRSPPREQSSHRLF